MFLMPESESDMSAKGKFSLPNGTGGNVLYRYRVKSEPNLLRIK
jgi:hypothetical protein